MPAKRNLSGLIEVDDHEYHWTIEREPQWCTADGWRGMVVSLRQADAPREALLEFPMPSARRSALQPQLRRPQVNGVIIENGVRAALAAGWEPTSRGKPAVFEVDANGN
ncbi:hypothetical protein [Sphingopyxis terrae]|uniref:Uncharacterized protein n=1 Tax=Sphingopyxis terrae subsp. ummariensis TaxID=429001 RepID=A0A1Y6ENR3_9SPHN|nr:hypothetical protein [Sphingopyxis terrae]MBU7590780.1 hypothetical protein [Sphingopyxis terrae]PCF92449.1 hypothetical protein CPA46_04865 [Sphingopyxis terrae subsp. ummariensis]SMQ64207.1 hypothetical protein SAMN06295984_0975 [Sphingopyxis terrae subsp. ummariensis]